MVRTVTAVLVLIFIGGSALAGPDLAKAYKATLDWEEGAPPRDWRCGPEEFDAALEKLADTFGLVVDLRFNGGGDEPMACRMAGRLLDRKRVYSLNRYRSGPRHKQLGRKLERAFEPVGPWRYESPVVTLFGRKTMSSAESFALMLAQCPQVTTMGDHTAGSSANPRMLNLPGGIVVRMPRWIDMDPDGNPIDEVGVAPDVKVEVDWTGVRNTDPVLEAALGKLRETPKKERRPGKR